MESNTRTKSKFDLEIREIKREKIRELLDQCTKDQVTFFNRMYGNIETIQENDMSWAYSQVKRTLDQNHKEGGLDESNM